MSENRQPYLEGTVGSCKAYKGHFIVELIAGRLSQFFYSEKTFNIGDKIRVDHVWLSGGPLEDHRMEIVKL